MRYFKMVVFTTALFVLMFRCASEVIIDLPDEEPRIVAVSHFTDGQPINVRVTISQPIYASGEPEIPVKADVSISTGGQFLDKLRSVFDEFGGLYWESRDSAETGETYSLVVRIPGMETIEAQSYVPYHSGLRPMEINSEDIRIVDLDETRKAYRIPMELRLERLPKTKRYFAFHLRHEIDVYEIVDGEPMYHHTYQTDSTYYLADGRTLSLLHNLVEPVVLINENLWDNSDQSLQIEALIPFKETVEKPRRIMVEWRTLSEEFYKYHLSLARQGNNNSPLNDPDAVYNNVLNGYGNFSGYAVSIDTIHIPN
ncbi:MAG: DUF4249 domain-containing protein [Saprospiraceae bacterium]|nr:DUF4249 domain-containing protein [Saprospiraceae bacterium]